ncbi:hypothetical protein PVAP13_2NG139200 [Panicum virgatum]|uniref:Uncharacterized protein n=1 Tax=Panicum virgatum TaxID=38727 RepID=A0A8T0VE55_PANVG|nr:hypothetical protein PVAP13_2NG139200 [Panicum virgatum]
MAARLLRDVASTAARSARGHRVPDPCGAFAGPGSRGTAPATQGLRHYAAPSSEAVGNLEMSLELDAPKPKRNQSRISKKSGTAMMLPLHFHYEDVIRQDST